MINKRTIDRKALVLLSGGQDSVTCLGLALGTYREVEAISFAYNQRHAVELQSAMDICRRHGVRQTVVQLGTLLSSLVVSALTSEEGDTSKPHPTKPSLPASFVPGRNALFLTLAHAHAQTIGAAIIIAGVCQTDFSGYPDCRAEFVQLLAHALNSGYQTGIEIETPLMYIDKAATFKLAADFDFLGEVIEGSHTCYNGDHTTRHEWGFGCGTCPACQLREKGWATFKEMYPGLALPFITPPPAPEPVAEKKSAKKR